MKEDTAPWYRIRIGQIVGFKPASILTKAHLNSIKAYVSGSFFVYPSDLYLPKAPDLLDMRIWASVEFDFDYDPGNLEEYPSGKPFDCDQLTAIYEGVRASEDHRRHPHEAKP